MSTGSMPEQREWPENHKPWGLSWNVIKPPIRGSKAAHRFFVGWADTNHLLAFVLYMVAHIEETNSVIRRYMQGLDASSALDGTENAKTPREILAHHRQLLSEMLLTRHVDNLLTYLSSLLHEVFVRKPELLRSSEKIEVREVLERESLDDMVRLLAERKVQSLAYQSFSEVSAYFAEQLGVVLFHEADLPIVVEAIETRNISAHSGCIINSRYLARTRRDVELAGSLRKLSLGEVEELAILLGRAVSRVDKYVGNKFQLESGSFTINPIHGHTNWKCEGH